MSRWSWCFSVEWLWWDRERNCTIILRGHPLPNFGPSLCTTSIKVCRTSAMGSPEEKSPSWHSLHLHAEYLRSLDSIASNRRPAHVFSSISIYFCIFAFLFFFLALWKPGFHLSEVVDVSSVFFTTASTLAARSEIRMEFDVTNFTDQVYPWSHPASYPVSLLLQARWHLKDLRSGVRF